MWSLELVKCFKKIFFLRKNASPRNWHVSWEHASFKTLLLGKFSQVQNGISGQNHRERGRRIYLIITNTTVIIFPHKSVLWGFKLFFSLVCYTSEESYMITASVCLSFSPPRKTLGAIGQIQYLQKLLCTIWEFRINQGLSRREGCTLPTVGKSSAWEQTWILISSLRKSPADVRWGIGDGPKTRRGEAMADTEKEESEIIAVDGWWEEARDSSTGNLNSLLVFPRTTCTIFSVGCQCFLDNTLCRPEQHRKESTEL